MRPPVDVAAIDRETDAIIARGHRIFQTHKYAPDDAEHVAFLLRRLDPPPGALVLDAGCGIGEVPRLMSIARPDLRFILMNVSMHQLALCPVGEQFCQVLDDCHETLLTTSSIDAVMFSSALCQMDTPVALAEAHRVLKPGGVLLVNDMVNEGGDRAALEQAVAARVLSRAELLEQVAAAGFDIDHAQSPACYSSHFDELAEEAGIGDLVAGIEPIIIRAIARKDASCSTSR